MQMIRVAIWEENNPDAASDLSLACLQLAKRCGPSMVAPILVGTSELHAHFRRGARERPSYSTSPNLQVD